MGRAVKVQPLSAMSYPMLRLTTEAILEHWQEITADDVYSTGREVKETAEYLSELFAEVARRIPI